MASRKNKRQTYQLYNAETGDHYTIRLTREAYDNLAGKKIRKYSKKKKAHVEFELKKRKFK